MDLYKNRPNELDIAVRRQLGSWFVDEKNDIMDKWELKKIFYVRKIILCPTPFVCYYWLFQKPKSLNILFSTSYIFVDSKSST